MLEIGVFGTFLYGMGILTGGLLGSALAYRRMLRRMNIMRRVMR